MFWSGSEESSLHLWEQLSVDFNWRHVCCLKNFILAPDKSHGQLFPLKLLTGLFILFSNIREKKKTNVLRK